MDRRIVLAAALAPVAALAACGAQTAGSSAAEPGVAAYVCAGSTSDLLLRWRSSGSRLSGTWESSQLSGQAPSEQVTSNSGDLSGTLSGSAITLQFGLGQPVYGSLNGSQLTLNLAQSDGSFKAGACSQSTLNGWNQAVGTLHGHAANDNVAAQRATAAQQQAQQVSQAQGTLANDISTLNSDATSLNNDKSLAGDIQSMQSDYQSEQGDYKTEQGDSCDVMSGDAGVVSGDAGVVSGDLGTLQGDISYLKSSGIQAVQNDLANVKADATALQNLGVTPSTDPSSAIAGARKALKSAANAITWAKGQGNAVNNEAQQLATTAQNYATSHCG